LHSLCYLNIRNNDIRILPSELVNLENINTDYCFGDGIYIGIHYSGNPITNPPHQVLEQDTASILRYLDNPLWWYIQYFRVWLLLSTGLLAALFLGFRYRQRRMLKSKKKREASA